MIVYADTHVHLYPSYHLAQAFESAWQNFDRINHGNTGVLVLYLTERSDCNFFEALRDRGETLVSPLEFRVESTSIPEVLAIRRAKGGEMFLVAGRQIKTAERLEILVLHTLEKFTDGVPIEKGLIALLGTPSVVVLNWSLGKWMFSRGDVMRKIIGQSAQGEFLLGDILGRPREWGVPKLLGLAKSKGISFVAGSDPLPFAGEEAKIASYVSKIELSADAESITNRFFFRDLLRAHACASQAVGTRDSTIEVFRRSLMNYWKR